MPWVRGRLAVATAAIVIVIGALYFWTAATSPDPGGSYHWLLAEAFEDGRTDLPVAPAPELLALPDPYDPVQNAPYRLHDASLYEGRYYLYFGPAPAALLFLPLDLVGVELTDRWAAPLLALGGFAASAVLLLFLIDRYRPRTPVAWRLVGVAGLGLANVVPFMLRRPAVYETSIAAGLLFLMLAVLLVVAGTLRERPSLGMIALGSLALGLAVGSRASLALAFPLLAWSWWRLIGPRSTWAARRLLRTGLGAAGPFAACLLLLALYNVVRFGSPTDFGTGYQLAGFNPNHFDYFRLDRVIPGAWFYALQPPHFGLDFPFVTLLPEYPGTLPAGFTLEPVAGILPVTPLLGFLIAVPLLARRARDPRTREMLWLGAILLGIALVLPLVPLVSLGGATERYLVDFATLAVVPATLAWLWLAERVPRRSARRVVLGVGTAAIAYCGVANLAFSVVGYYDGLRAANPGTYASLEGAFAWVPTLAAKLRGEPVVLETRPPPGTPAAESVVQLAAPGAGTAVVAATPVAATLPPGSLVPADVRGPDGPVTRIRMTIGTRTQMTVRLGGAGLADIRIGWGVARVAGTAAPVDAGTAGAGLADIRVVEWSPR